jgi:hypothetical protein
MEKPIKVLMVCETEADGADVSAMLKRISSALSAVDSFSDKMTELDEDAPNLTEQVAPMLERLTLTLMSIYPDARQMAADVKAIGDFTVRTI